MRPCKYNRFGCPSCRHVLLCIPCHVLLAGTHPCPIRQTKSHACMMYADMTRMHGEECVSGRLIAIMDEGAVWHREALVQLLLASGLRNLPGVIVSCGFRVRSEDMAFPRLSVMVLMLVVFLLVNVLAPSVNAQAPAPAPMSDGTSIDQGIAYILMFVALLLTYLIHPLDAFPYNLF
eukprot:Gb_09983 [translate_table: standard]